MCPLYPLKNNKCLPQSTKAKIVSSSVNFSSKLKKGKKLAAVLCVGDAYRLGGVKLGLGLMGKLGHAWVGAWVGGG